MRPQPVSDVELVFPASVVDRGLFPKEEDVPEAFFDRENPWAMFARRWFNEGCSTDSLIPKFGIDKGQAIRHLKVCMGSFAPRHEHKIAGVAYLLSQWFEPL